MTDRPNDPVSAATLGQRIRGQVTGFMDELAHLGFIDEDRPVNGGDLVDALNRDQPNSPAMQLRDIHRLAKQAGGSDPLFEVLSFAVGKLKEVGFYRSGPISGGDATDAMAEVYARLREEPALQDLVPSVIFSPTSGFLTPSGWGDLEDALVWHDTTEEVLHAALKDACAKLPARLMRYEEALQVAMLVEADDRHDEELPRERG